MAEILPGVHLVEGVDPQPDFTTHVYLLKDKGSSWTLIDTGLPGKHTAVLAYLEKIHVPPSSVKKILLTHLHRDHTGSLAAMAKATGARTFAHWLEAAFIANDPTYDGPGTPPEKGFPVDERLKDGDTIDAAGGLVAFHTPGHTPGHTSYYQTERKILFSGDLFFGEGTKLTLTPKEYTHHTLSAQVSARRMSQLALESVMSYHGGPFLSNAGTAVRHLVGTFG
jgi:glyoxylase-like metal-dependent hydrolase (beta-lactamase superfamily II)